MERDNDEPRRHPPSCRGSGHTADLPAVVGALAEAQAIAQLRLSERAEATRVADVPAVELLDAKEMASRLQIAPSWLLDQARQGRVPHVRLGKYVRFQPGAVLEWASARQAAAGGHPE